MDSQVLRIDSPFYEVDIRHPSVCPGRCWEVLVTILQCSCGAVLSLISIIHAEKFTLIVRGDAFRVQSSVNITNDRLSHRWRTWHTKRSNG